MKTTIVSTVIGSGEDPLVDLDEVLEVSPGVELVVGLVGQLTLQFT